MPVISTTRARHSRDIERLGTELEAETARLRDAERRLEELRNQHYRSGDELHAAQGALYETNAEIARLAALRTEMVAMVEALPAADCRPPVPGNWCPPAEGGDDHA